MDPLGDGDAELDLDSMLGYEEEHAPPEPANADPRRKKVVCKHWLRGLCKRGDDCDFLHRLDQDRMPECLFFQYYGECNNKDCIFLHTRKEDRAKECEWYERGFCKHGPRCRNRHMRKKVCAHYLAGFCPEGPSCPLAHPHFSLPLAQGAVLPGAAGIREQQMAGERFRQCPPVPQQWQQQQAQMMSFTQHQQHMQQLEQMQMMQEQHMWGGGGKPMFY